jgi:hypothetical protein
MIGATGAARRVTEQLETSPRMASDKQVTANKRNAKESTGPKSQAGKKKSAMNAIKHGGTATGLLPDESIEEQTQFIDAITEQYNPRSPDASVLVEIISDGLWRRRRFSRAEAGVMTWYVYKRLGERIDEESGSLAPEGSPGAKKAELRKRQSDISHAAQAFIVDVENGNVLEKMSRYETTIVNRVFRAMKELRELNAQRIEPADDAAGPTG